MNNKKEEKKIIDLSDYVHLWTEEDLHQWMYAKPKDLYASNFANWIRDRLFRNNHSAVVSNFFQLWGRLQEDHLKKLDRKFRMTGQYKFVLYLGTDKHIKYVPWEITDAELLMLLNTEYKYMDIEGRKDKYPNTPLIFIVFNKDERNTINVKVDKKNWSNAVARLTIFFG